MDGENNGKPYEQMDDLGGFPIFLVQHTYQAHIPFPRHFWVDDFPFPMVEYVRFTGG